MQITKVNGSFNEYKLEISYAELLAIRDALARSHAGPVGDELYSGIVWYIDKLPPPGVEEEDEEEEGAKAPAKKHSKEPGSLELPDPDDSEGGSEDGSEGAEPTPGSDDDSSGEDEAGLEDEGPTRDLSGLTSGTIPEVPDDE